VIYPEPVIIEDDEGIVMARLIGSNQRVLDCGCGSGRMARLLAENGCQVVGIDLDPERVAQAQEVCLRVIQGNLMEPEIWQKLGSDGFDVILFSHVLEHLMAATGALRAAVQRVRLGGRLVAIVPNVANWRVRLHLLAGRWEYQDAGILDRTHVRFFTLKTAVEFLTSAGLQIMSLRVALRPPGGWFVRKALVRLLRRVLPVSLFAESFIFEMIPRSQRK